LAPLGIPAFRRFFFSQTAALLSTQVYVVALTWLVTQVMGTGTALGTVLMVGAIPRAVFMLFGGAIADRFSPRRVLIVSTGVSAVVLGALAALNAFGTVQIWQIYLIAAMFGLIDALFFPAAMAMSPRLVPPDQLNAAGSLTSGIEQITNIIGPGLAGLLIATVGLPVTFALNTALFVTAHVLLRGIREKQPVSDVPPDQRKPLLRDIQEGLQYAWREPAIRASLVMIAALNFAFIGPLIVGGALLAERRFGGDPLAFAAMLSAWGVGALIGTVAAGMANRFTQPGRLLVGVAAVLGSGLIAIGFLPNAAVVIAIMGVMGIGGGFVGVVATVWLQQKTPRAMQGRVMSVLAFAAVALDPLSQGISGFLADLSLEFLFCAAGGTMLLTALISLTNRAIRNPEPEQS
jgi:MFS family permease